LGYISATESVGVSSTLLCNAPGKLPNSVKLTVTTITLF